MELLGSFSARLENRQACHIKSITHSCEGLAHPFCAIAILPYIVHRDRCPCGRILEQTGAEWHEGRQSEKI
eukprot:3114604-Pleurochrysis_carterae.AAC.3